MIRIHKTLDSYLLVLKRYGQTLQDICLKNLQNIEIASKSILLEAKKNIYIYTIIDYFLRKSREAP